MYRLVTLWVGLLSVILTSSCGRSDNPVFTGRLYVIAGEGLYQISSNQESNEADVRYVENTSQIHAGHITVSYDPRYLIYATSNGIYLDDTKNNEANLLVTLESIADCVEINQDGTMLSYVYNHEIYVFDLTSTTKMLLLSAPSAEYTEHSTSAPLVGIGRDTIYGQFTCGFWQGRELLFQRYEGRMPDKIEGPIGNELPPNTTTLATFDGGVSLRDIDMTDAPYIYINDISADGNYVFLHKDGDAYISKSLTNFDNLKGPIDETDHQILLKFVPGGDELYYVNWSNQVILIDPKSLSERMGPRIDTSWIMGGQYGLDLTWVGGVEDNLIVIAEYSKRNGRTADIFLLDLDTERKTFVANLLGNGTSPPVNFVGWLPLK